MDYAADYAIHGGDIAYDLFASNPAKDNGNRFMNAIEPLTSRVQRTAKCRCFVNYLKRSIHYCE